MNYIHARDYDADTHIGYEKYAQVAMAKSQFNKPLPTITQIIYADFDPNTHLDFGRDCRHVLINESIIAEPGMVLDPNSLTPDNTNFLSATEAFRLLHTDEEILTCLRVSRNAMLSQLDYLILRHMSQIAKTLSDAEFLELQTYMQALRDFPANVDLNNITWPTKPAFVS